MKGSHVRAALNLSSATLSRACSHRCSQNIRSLFSLIDCVSVGVDGMQRNFEPMRKQVEAWQRFELTDVTAKVVIYEAFVEIRTRQTGSSKHLARTVHNLTVHAKAPRRDGSWEQAVALPKSCYPARRSRDFPYRDFHCACGRVLFGFSSRYPAARSRCHGIVRAFADATRRPRLPLIISFPLHRQAEDAAHAPSSL
jgi:hypothetical protein